MIDSNFNALKNSNAGRALSVSIVPRSADESEEDPQEGFNGTLTDWSNVESYYKEAEASIYVKETEEQIFFGLAYQSDANEVFQLAINSDADTETGMLNDWFFNGGGMDFVIEGSQGWANFYYMPENSSEWGFSESLVDGFGSVIDRVNKTAEFVLDKESLDRPEHPLTDSITFGIALKDSSWQDRYKSNEAEALVYEWLYQAGEEEEENPVPGEELFVEGAYHSWYSGDLLLEEENNSIYFFEDDSHFYTLSRFSFEDIASWQLWFDADLDASSGYPNQWTFVGAGAEGHFQGGLGFYDLQIYNGENGDWPFTYQSFDGLEASFDPSAKILEMKIAKDAMASTFPGFNGQMQFGLHLTDSSWSEVYVSNQGQWISTVN